MRTFDTTIELTVRITINDENVIDRVLQNQDDQGVPQPLGSGRGWQDNLYTLTSAEKVIEMLAYNYVVNDRQAHQLDGWADIEVDWRNPYIAYAVDRGSVEMDTREIEHADG